jgi:trans-AT polyketide synthase, acyltransferase and oxidoreductase domains
LSQLKEAGAAPPFPVSSVSEDLLRESLRRVARPFRVVEREGSLVSEPGTGPSSDTVAGYVPPCLPANLGDSELCAELGLRLPYIGGSMAKGISSVRMAEEFGREGMLAFFGAAGLPFSEVETAVARLSAGDFPYGCNLIHSPHEPDLENALAELYVRKGVRMVEASAFLGLTLPLVRYRVAGIGRLADGTVSAPNRIIAKVSREELAAKFFAPPPEAMLRELVAMREITEEQAKLAATIPIAGEITAEADSGGHTDNRPAIALFPTIASLATRLRDKHGYAGKLRVGLGGGISTPESAAAAFAMGAAYVMTGSVNQACIESGTSAAVREMLATTRQADVTMAPAADMFEMGVTVQVLKRGTMFPMRGAKLYDIYRAHAGLDDIPAVEREKLEKTVFCAPLADIWRDTREYFLRRDPRQAERGDRDPKHRMALVFRWYLGQAAHWAKDGEPARRMDYQVWCGPAMGAFNEWTEGTFLAAPERRKVVDVALNILFGAAVLTRANFLRCQGIPLPHRILRTEPLEPEQIKEYLR